MSVFDKTFRNLAAKLINTTFGTSAVIRREVSTFVLATGSVSKTATDYAVKISPPAPVSERRAGGEVGAIQLGDASFMLAASTAPIVPNPVTDKLVWRGYVYQVVLVLPFVSGDQDAAYEVVIRK